MANEVRIKVIIDDGEVKKQLGKTEKDAASTGELIAKKIKDALEGAPNKSLKTFSDNFGSASSFILKSFGLMTIAASAFAIELRNAIKGEQINAINAQFELLTSRVGVAGEALKQAFIEKAAGLVDTTHILQTANGALVELGHSAEKLPQLFELARKVSSVFGGTAVENFEAITRSISGLNTRSLRNIGIVIEQETALKSFAKQQGLTVDLLNETGKQQAILNAVLEKGKTSFNEVNINLRPISDNLQRLSVSLKEITEVFAISAQQKFGGFFESLTKTASDFAEKVKNVLGSALISGPEQAAFKVKLLEQNLEQAKKQLVEINELPAFLQFFQLDIQVDIIKSLEKQLSKLKPAADEAHDAMNRVFGPRDLSQNVIQTEEFKKNLQSIKQETDKVNNDILQSNIRRLETNQQFEQADAQKKLLVEQQRNLQLQELKNKFQSDELQKTSEFKNLQKAIEARASQDIVAINEAASRRISDVTKIVRTGIVSGLTTAFAALGAALAKSKNGFEAFGKAILGVIGGLAIQIGSFLVTTGLGFGPLNPPASAVMVAKGLALIVLGGALQALGGGGEDGGGVSAGGGGVAAAPSTATEVPEIQPTQPQTAVTVNIQGNILDRRQTGLEIAEAINEAFGTQGIVFAGAV